MTNEIPTPFNYPVVTPEVLQYVLEKTGAKSVFIAIADEDSQHVCTKECQGHYMNMNLIGFNAQGMLGIAAAIAKSAGLKLVDNNE